MTRRACAVASSVALCVCLLASSPAHARDWFVRAGADGDGSIGKPFGDPWQALDKCEAGDAVHIAGGRYYGRTSAGTWVIPYDNVQLYGGYALFPKNSKVKAGARPADLQVSFAK